MENENNITENNAEPTPSGIPEPDEKLYTQAEFKELLEAEREKFEEKLAEAEKLAGMSEDARSEYKRELLDKELSEREAAVAKRELMAEASERLTDVGLPRELAKCLDYSGRKEFEISLREISRLFGDAVSSEIRGRINRKPPMRASCDSSDAFLTGLGI